MVVASTACWSTDTIDSTDVEQDEIHGDYAVTFDDETGSLRATAQFRVGGPTGTTVRLQSPSEVRFEGQSMTVRDGDEALINIIGTYYRASLSVEQPEAEYLFSWTDGEGRTFDNVLEMAESIEVIEPFEDVQHSRGEDLVVEFDPPVGPGDESVTCYLFGPDAEEEDEDEIDSDWVDAGSQCIFTKETLASFVDGRARLEVRRRLEHEHQQGHHRTGADMSSTYESAPVFVELVP